MIIYDKTKNREIERTQIQATSRNDVKSAYPNLKNAANSGFSASFTLTDEMVGDEIQIISRYSAALDGNSDYVDYWFAPVIFNKNYGSLDTVSISNTGLAVTGWHAADESFGKANHFLILFDKTTGEQISSTNSSSVQRNDVAKVYGSICNASRSGFSAILSAPGINLNDDIALVSRYSTSNSGNGSEGKYVDYWFTLPQFDTSNRGILDTFSFNGDSTLQATGWHATNLSVGKPYHYVILFDETTGKQVASVQSSIVRNDVAQVYESIETATDSGFDVKFQFDPSLVNHNLVVVSRYSSSNSGNGSSGNYVDYWFTPNKFSNSGYSIDHFTASGNNPIHLDGWFASDQSVGKPNAFIIVLDQLTGKEVARNRVTLTTRNDVASAYPNLYNSRQSGFSVDIPVTGGMSGEKIGFILRFSGDQTGNSDFSDIYSDTYNMPNENKGYFDNISVEGDNIEISGWHAATGSYLKNYEYLIVVDMSGKELGRVEVENSHLQRNDVFMIIIPHFIAHNIQDLMLVLI